MFTSTLCLATVLLTTALAAKKSCPPYPHVFLEHGHIRRVAPSKYTIHCHKGYKSFINKVQCYEGQWQPIHAPNCRKIQGECFEPPTVDNADVYGDERHEGATVKYMCKDGFTLLGNHELSCTKSRYWNKLPPTCMDTSEPFQNVAERLNSSFVTHIANFSADTPMGQSLDQGSLRLGLELYILVDRSSSVDPVQLEDAKNFIKFLLERFYVKNGNDNDRGIRASVLAFGTEVQRVFTLDNKNISNFKQAGIAIDAIQPNGGGTNLETALIDVVLDADLEMLREDSKRALFIMTDGEPNIANPEITPQDIAARLRDAYQFEIFTVGIGKGINMHLLNELASEPPLSHVFMLENYANLNEVMKIIQSTKPEPPPISKYQCGYNGTSENQPWSVIIYIGDTVPFKVCGGVLICSQWVLTAASCLQDGHNHVHKRDVFVVLGERNLVKSNTPTVTNFYVKDMHIHPSYDPREKVSNDLALLKLYVPEENEDTPEEEKHIRFRPACLPLTDTVLKMHLNLKISATVAGWGTTSASKMTYANASDLNLFDVSTTSVSLLAEHECPVSRRGLSKLCAGQGTRTCYGLIGSPLIAEDPKTQYQHVLGILAHRSKCAKGKNQYVELTEYVNWINEKTFNCQLKHWGFPN